MAWLYRLLVRGVIRVHRLTRHVGRVDGHAKNLREANANYNLTGGVNELATQYVF
jgi:hypothetical protein